ncbi:class II histone deacetylase [Roseovarius rhodophyticola]|uniref:Class II histone deacetylase n=1 Tax=Roseovarius rhodophyticola TaxID=3080827 RepID=A0ABZ2TPQ8_9RHOB|nr:class II histone deacetylase [Roseovarius sp. W115]MDV2927878.1 class II histone deacetylase [Roseovarius sp. W115]
MEPSLELQPGLHFENPETKRRLHNLVEATDLAPKLHAFRPRKASDEIIRTIHPQSHIDHIAAVCASGGGDAGQLTPVGPASLDIARLAVGGVVAAVDNVLTGEWDNAYVLCRPPGHHALPDVAMGFCLFANAAIGVKYAMNVHGIKRVATIDWDVHHGNGTETIFYDDPSVLTISLHQNNLFPLDSGPIEALGEGAGKGFNLNIPLPPGTGTGGYIHAFEEVVIPALEDFKPELIIIPSGFDSCAMDPLGMQMLKSSDYALMTTRLMEVADKHAKGRIIVTHEGGYSPQYVPYCGLAVLEALSGTNKTFEDPFNEFIGSYGGQTISKDQEALIQSVKDIFFKT